MAEAVTQQNPSWPAADKASLPPPTPPLQTSLETKPRSVEDDQPDVESPSLSTPSARARFEFEPGRGGAGTKVLMVEWEDDDLTRDISGAWTVSWEGKSHVLPADEKGAAVDAAESDISAPSSSLSTSSMASAAAARRPSLAFQPSTSHRIFFLLPAKKPVPATVTLTLNPTDNSVPPTVWKTHPLPAIFPPSLTDSFMDGPTKRGKGVLHGLWAKKRLQTLEREIEAEAKLNCEGIALQMAIGEKEWIENTFGISTTLAQNNPLAVQALGNNDAPLSPMSPLSPGGSRLSEKLKGLKLQTTEGPALQQSINITSPEEADVAVPLCQKKRERLAENVATTVPAAPQVLDAPATTPSFARPAQRNPTRALHPETTSSTSMFSLGAVLSGQGLVELQPKEDEEEELFALPLSPRSPEMTKSPFSFAAEDTRRYMNIQKVA